MKTKIILSAIRDKNNIKFLYNEKETIIEPYYLSWENSAGKIIYGRLYRTKEIRRFEYNKIKNIHVMKNLQFTPVIPIVPLAS